MAYNTENGALLQKLPDKSQISGKLWWILLMEIEKKEITSLKTFQKLLEYLFIYLFILYLSLDTNIKSKYLQEELKGKSNFVQ